MIQNHLKELIAKGEGIDIEFKESKSKLNKDLFDTICAFLNRIGGHIFLGVKDNKQVVGLDLEIAEKLKQDLLTALNNPQKINPTVYLSVEIMKIDHKNILYIPVPNSAQVHHTSGKIFDRNGDGDFEITNNTNLVANMYIRKQTESTENRVFPYATLDDLNLDLIKKVRTIAANRKVGIHPWQEMNDLELLKSSGLYARDKETNKEGLTLGAILLFGKDVTIRNALSHHKTDAILRVKNLDRYDDRDIIETNLIDSFGRLMAFVNKHLNDPFYLEGNQRISIRDKIFREGISNMLIHREFTNGFIAKMIYRKKSGSI